MFMIPFQNIDILKTNQCILTHFVEFSVLHTSFDDLTRGVLCWLLLYRDGKDRWFFVVWLSMTGDVPPQTPNRYRRFQKW